MDKLWYLSKISIFDTLPKEDLLEIDRMAPMTHFNALPKGTMVQTPDTYREGLYFVKLGKLRIYNINPDGKQFTAGILGPGNMFGEIDSFSFGTNDVYIETMEETLICSVLKDHFENFLSKRPKLALKFLKELSNQLKVRERVIHLLVKLSNQFGKDEGMFRRIELALSHQEMART